MVQDPAGSPKAIMKIVAFFIDLQIVVLIMAHVKIVFQKVCKFQFIYFCNRTVKNDSVHKKCVYPLFFM